MYTIEKNVPLPENRLDKIHALLVQMNDGDSFEFPCEDLKLVRYCIDRLDSLLGALPSQSCYVVRDVNKLVWRVWLVRPAAQPLTN